MYRLISNQGGQNHEENIRRFIACAVSSVLLVVSPTLPQNEIVAQYSCDVPAYITGIRYDSSSGTYKGHAVALVGYKKQTEDNNVYMIYYMNPQNGAIEYFGYAEGLENKFSNNVSGVIYTWDNSITLV